MGDDLRLIQRDPSPLHPAVNVHTLRSGDHVSGFMAGSPSPRDPSTAPDVGELRRRMATYVRDQLVTHPEIVATGWPLEVHWNEASVTATLTRGELVIPAEWRRRDWWMPQRRSAARQIVDSLAWILIATHRMYADADETGRTRRGDLVLEPGVREEGGGASPYGRERYCRIGEDVALPLEAAVAAGWVVVD